MLLLIILSFRKNGVIDDWKTVERSMLWIKPRVFVTTPWWWTALNRVYNGLHAQFGKQHLSLIQQKKISLLVRTRNPRHLRWTQMHLEWAWASHFPFIIYYYYFHIAFTGRTTIKQHPMVSLDFWIRRRYDCACQEEDFGHGSSDPSTQAGSLSAVLL